jgi:hypothetical protein
MTHVTWRFRSVCLSVIASLFVSTAVPAWADSDDDSSDYKDPSIVEDEATSVPDGAKRIAEEEARKKKEIANPVYGQWWFLASAVAVAGAWIAFSVLPLHKRAAGCNTSSGSGETYPLGCVGDGR